jgi:hypothetical protein
MRKGLGFNLRLSILLFSLVISYLSPFSIDKAYAAPTLDCTISSGSLCRATFPASGSRENWVVPAGITSITVDVQGAAGADGASPGGKGARMQATLTVTPSSTLVISVGLKGAQGNLATNTSYSSGVQMRLGGGGGGGSYLVGPSTTPLVIAGGGGGGQGPCCFSSSGAYASYPGLDATTTRAGTAGSSAASGAFGAIGTESYGGNTTVTNGAGGGGGWIGDGGTGSAVNQYGRGFGNGSSISTPASEAAGWGTGGAGGFGGGGAGYGGAGGGGGGYTGGGGGGGSSNWGAGGGGGSFLAVGASSTSSTAGYQSGNGLITITYLNAPTPTSFTSSQASPTNTASSITYSITFSQNVNSIAAGDFSNAGTATGCSFSPSASSGTTITISISSCSEGTLTPQLLANSVFGTVTSTNGPASNSSASNTVVIDRTAPTISSVTGPANATYRPTQALSFTANFSETVTVTGTPRLALTIGSTARYANYASGTNTRALVFSYTVASSASDIDSDGIAVSTTLDLNSGTIVDLASNALSALTFSAPTLTSVLVAQPPAAPTIDSISATSGQLSVYFTAGATNGAAITNYEFSTNNGSSWTTRSPIATTSPLTITGLSNGTSYNVRLRAINGAGTSDSSTAVSATPTAVVVGGGSNISTTYGSAASSSQFTATGGTSPYTFTLSSTPTGVSISNGVVTASATTNAGTYTQNVVATDAASQSGTKQIVITVGQVTPTISISLAGGVTDAALGSAITITATVSQGGSVNFRLGGSSISGCSSVTSSAGSATCSWTPASLGGVVLTAVLTPSDSTNYTNATSSNLNITVVNGVTTVSLSLAGGVTTVAKGQFIVITATVDQAGRISFMADGKRIPSCTNLSVSGSSKTCRWKPAVRGQVNLSSRLVPTNSAYSTTSASLSVLVVARTGPRA